MNNTALNLKNLRLRNARLVPSWARKTARGGSAKEWHPQGSGNCHRRPARKDFFKFLLVKLDRAVRLWRSVPRVDVCWVVTEMKRRSADVRVHNPVIGELVLPELNFLINLLSQINSADAQLVIEHARKIYTAHQLLRGRPDDHGFKIEGKIRRRAEPVPATRGLKDDLQRLLKAARGGSAKEW